MDCANQPHGFGGFVRLAHLRLNPGAAGEGAEMARLQRQDAFNIRQAFFELQLKEPGEGTLVPDLGMVWRLKDQRRQPLFRKASDASDS